MTQKIALRGDSGQGKFALVSDGDFRNVARYKWHLDAYGYPARSVWNGTQSVKVYLHTEVMGRQPGMYVDHVDGDKLNNRRSNLRFVTSVENSRNRSARKGTSEYKGVSWNARLRKWCVYIGIEKGRNKYLGMYDDEIEAAKVYDEACRKYYGEHARPNFA